MGEITRWRFPLRDGGTIQGFNDSGIATFKGAELYNNLAREICQNSLDAKADGKDHVIVKFSLRSLPKNKFNAITNSTTLYLLAKSMLGRETQNLTPL